MVCNVGYDYENGRGLYSMSSCDVDDDAILDFKEGG